MTHMDGGQTDSLWMRSLEARSRAPLAEDISADVCIVGAGVGGLTTAYLLAAAGKNVVVIDDGPVGGGETGRSSAHLSNAMDEGYTRIEREHGANGSRLAAESHAAAINLIERLCTEHKIDCGFARVPGYLFSGKELGGEELERELEASRRAGLGTEMVGEVPWPQLNSGPALQFPDQAEIDPLLYVGGLVKAVEELGGKIFTGTHAAEFQEDRVLTQLGATVTAPIRVIATNSPVNDRVAIHLKQAAYRTYVIGFEIPKDSLPGLLCWDTAEPYHYLRLDCSQLDTDIVLIGGEDHKTGQDHSTQARFVALERWARERLPDLGPAISHWSGQIMEPVDGLAFLGKNPGDENVYIITGDSGQGLTHGTIGAMIICDLILARPNPWTSLYDPSRVSLRGLAGIARENLNVAAQYTALMTAGEVSDVEELSPGQGAVVRRGLTKIAAFCDEGGLLHECSAICPHLGCVVEWNNAEKTWDCPCHGSRFDPRGRVLNGPALSDLVPLEDDIPPVTPLPLTTA